MDDLNPTPSAEGKDQLPNPEKGKEAGQEPSGEVEKAKVVEGTPPKVWTQTEVDAIRQEERQKYAGLDKRLTQSEQSHKTQLEGLNKTLEEAEERIAQAEARSFIRQVEEEGGDVNAAKRMVARQEVIAKQERQVKALEVALRAKEETLNVAGKVKSAHDFIKQYELDEGTLNDLLQAETPTEMELKAVRLHLDKIQVAATPAKKVDSGKAVSKSDLSKLPASSALGQLMEEAKEGR